MEFNNIPEEILKVAKPIITIQNILLGLTAENIEDSIDKLLELKMSQSRTGLVYICNDLMQVISVRPYKTHVFAQCIASVSKKNQGLYSLILAQIVQPATDSHIKAIHYRILRELHQMEIVSQDEIITAIANFPEKSPNQYMLFFLFFAKEFEQTNMTIFNALADKCLHLKNLGPTYVEFQKDILPTLMRQAVEFDFKWNKVEDLVQYGYLRDTAPLLAIQNVRRGIDKVSALDLDKLFDPSPFDISLFATAKSNISQRAAFAGAYESLRGIMSKKAKFRNPDSDGNFIQAYAVASGSLKIVQTLEERMLDFTGMIDLCCRWRGNECFEFLLGLEKDDESRKTQLNKGLLASAQSNNVVCLLKCLENGADPMAKSEDGKTALHYASIQGSIFTAKIMTMWEGVNVNARDDLGNTPLHYAAGSGNVEVLNLLLKHPNILKTIKNNYGKTALEETEQ